MGDRGHGDAHDEHDELDGTWRVDRIGSEGRLDTPARGTKPIVFFDADTSTLAIGTGCNTLRSSWALVGDHLETGAAAQTLTHCDEPALQDQEAALARILDPDVRVHVAPGRLALLDRLHRILVVATRPE